MNNFWIKWIYNLIVSILFLTVAKKQKKQKEVHIMFNFCSLYSGSSGNSLYVETENTRLLIDAGVSSKKIESALTNLDVDPASIMVYQ